MGVVDVEFALDERLDAGENVAVDEVKEVEGSEQEEGGGGGSRWVDAGSGCGGHRVEMRIAGGLAVRARFAPETLYPETLYKDEPLRMAEYF